MLLTLRLVEVKTGQTIAQVDAFAGKSRKQSSLSAETLRGAVAPIADKLHYDIGRLPGDTRYQRIAVMPLEENGTAAQNLALGSFLQQEISTELRERGFLSVERSQLKKAIAQIGLAQALSAENAPSTGKMLGAQVLVVGAVSEAGQHFVITGRAIDAQSETYWGMRWSKQKREYCHPRFRRYRDPKYGWGCFSLHTCPGMGQFISCNPSVVQHGPWLPTAPLRLL